jgi:voltage-gated potassium channel
VLLSSGCSRYNKNMKVFLHQIFVNQDSREYRLVNDFLALLTIVSIVSVVLETVPSLSPYSRVFLYTEWFAVFFFSLEYIFRTWASQPKWQYSISFFGIIDLISILPTFLGLGNFTFLKSARALRIVRMLRMFRLAKISRRKNMPGEGMSVLSLNIVIYLVTLLLALLLTGTFMFLAEGGQSAFVSIPSSMWWSLKVFMAGIPVVEPVTALGEFFFVVTRFVGLLLLGLLIGVVGNVFKVMVLGEK